MHSVRARFRIPDAQTITHSASSVAYVLMLHAAASALKLDAVRQRSGWRVPPPAARAAGLARFGLLFLGRLWDVYARPVLYPGLSDASVSDERRDRSAGTGAVAVVGP